MTARRHACWVRHPPTSTPGGHHAQRQQGHHPGRDRPRRQSRAATPSSTTTPSASRPSSRTSTSTPYFRGLPDDRCQCTHLGVCDRRPDHLPLARPRGDLRRRVTPTSPLPATSRSSPPAPASSSSRDTAELGPVMEAIGRNLEAMAERGGDVMSTHTAPRPDAHRGRSALADRLVEWLEDGVRRDDLFAPDAFTDLSLPHWRVQATRRGRCLPPSGRTVTRSERRYGSSGSSPLRAAS